MENKRIEIGGYSFELKPFTDKTGQEWLQIALSPDNFRDEMAAGKSVWESIDARGVAGDINFYLEVVNTKLVRQNRRFYILSNNPDHPGVKSVLHMSQDDVGLWVKNRNIFRSIAQKLPFFGKLLKSPLDEIRKSLEKILPEINAIIAGSPRREGLQGDVHLPLSPGEEVGGPRPGPASILFIGKGRKEEISKVMGRIAQHIQAELNKELLSSKRSLKPDSSLQNINEAISTFIIGAVELTISLTGGRKREISQAINKITEKAFETKGDRSVVLRRNASITDIAMDAAVIYEKHVDPERADERARQSSGALLQR